MNDIIKEFSESKKDITGRLKDVGDKWNFDNLSLTEYNDYFQPYLGESIEDLRDSIMQRKGRVKVANVMGGSRVLRDLEASESYAVRLTDDRDPETKEKDKNKNIILIPGNIASNKTLDQIPGDLDIVLAMPAGAWIFLPSDRRFFYLLGSKLVEKMADKGTAILQLPYDVNTWMGDYLKQTEGAKGLSFTFFPKDTKGIESILIIRKTSPDAKLPIGK